MTILQNIKSAIISGQFTNDELSEITDAVKFARSQIVRQNTGSLVLGTNVKFTNSRTGQTVIGKVVKVNRKYIHVQEANTYNSNLTRAGTWRVPANMLTPA
jgi:hypothetical protein